MEWKEVTLGEVSSKIGDGLHGTPKYDEEGSYYFINGNNLNCGQIIIKDDTKRVGIDEFVKNQKELNEQTILVSINGTIGNVAKYNNEPCILGKSACYINVIKEVDKEFIYYVLTSANFKRNITNEATGTTIKNVSLKQMREYKFNIPCNLEDQRRIASILTSLDRKIELNNKINADLEEMAQAIFKNWFVDFEPFEDGKFVDSELGMIPEGWKVGSLGDFCNVFTGRKNTNQAIEKGLYPFFSCAPEPLASNEAIFNGKAIIIAGNGSYTGRTSFYNGGFDLYQRTYACTIRERDKENLMIFFYHMMKQFFEPVKMGGTRGSSIPYIVMGDITQQKFPYSEDWLLRFSNIANSMMDKKLRIDKENSRLSLLRDTLLPRLMSGEIEIPE